VGKKSDRATTNKIEKFKLGSSIADHINNSQQLSTETNSGGYIKAVKTHRLVPRFHVGLVFRGLPQLARKKSTSEPRLHSR
jgi:hypothetical protein